MAMLAEYAGKALSLNAAIQAYRFSLEDSSLKSKECTNPTRHYFRPPHLG